jgi:cell division septation protein DedD
VPGTIVVVPGRPADEDERRRAWRRAGTWRVWQPVAAQPVAAQPATAQPATAQPATAQPATAQPATAQPAEPAASPSAGVPAAELVTPDLQDAVCVAALRAELDAVDA